MAFLRILLLELAVASLLAKQSGKFFLDKDVTWLSGECYVGHEASRKQDQRILEH